MVYRRDSHPVHTNTLNHRKIWLYSSRKIFKTHSCQTHISYCWYKTAHSVSIQMQITKITVEVITVRIKSGVFNGWRKKKKKKLVLVNWEVLHCMSVFEIKDQKSGEFSSSLLSLFMSSFYFVSLCVCQCVCVCVRACVCACCFLAGIQEWE